MPAKTEAQRRTQRDYEQRTDFAAQNKYIKEKCVKMTFTFSPADEDILNRLDTISESKAGYIKRLIREDIAKIPELSPNNSESKNFSSEMQRKHDAENRMK